MSPAATSDSFVQWFRASSPYIHAHRGRTFVLAFGGEAVADQHFAELVHDLALLQGLGIRLVLVHGARPQIEQRLTERGAQFSYANGLRVTDDAALACVKEAAGTLRVEIEALLSQGVANSPMAGTRIRVASGNFVTARPLGVLNGVDHCHTGSVRRVDAEAIRQQLDQGAVALIPPLGYSPTGEVFNLSAADVAANVAIALGADKLIFLLEGKGLGNRVDNHLTPGELERLIKRRRSLPEETVACLHNAADACRSGVRRVHLLRRAQDGVLLRELFTRDGAGTLVTAEPYETTRAARIDDVTGILELLAPLEDSGALVRRSRELLETEIGRFVVMERDGLIIACAALYPYPADGTGELAAVAVHPDYRDQGRGDRLLAQIEQRARSEGLTRLFVLTTQTAHWFRERGFEPRPLDDLPQPKRSLYNLQRRSKLFVKQL